MTFLTGLALFCLAMGWRWWREPRWQGRNVAQWFQEYQQKAGGRKQQEALQGFVALKESAGPFLIHKAQGMGEFSPTMRFAVWCNRRGVLVSYSPDSMLGWLQQRYELEAAAPHDALEILRVLRLPAEAMRHVCPALTDPNPTNQLEAMAILGTAGSGASEFVPLLKPFLTSTNMLQRHGALQSLSDLGESSAGAVSEFTQLLSVNGTSWVVLRTLGKIGPPAVAALPELRRLAVLDHENSQYEVLQIAITALAINPNEAWASDWIRESFYGGADRWAMLGRWTDFTNVAALFIPELWLLTDSDNLDVWSPAIDLLQTLQADPERLILTLERRLAVPDEKGAVNAMVKVLRLQSEHPAAIRALRQRLQSADPTFALFALQGLQMDRVNPSLLSEVRSLRASSNAMVQAQADQTWYEMTGQISSRDRE